MAAKRGDPGAPREDQEGNTPNKSKKELDRELDKALQDSFPASGPPACPQPNKPSRLAILELSPEPRELMEAIICKGEERPCPHPTNSRIDSGRPSSPT